MKTIAFIAVALVGLAAASSATGGEQAELRDYSPRPSERQLPRAMHSQMEQRPSISVGRAGADIVGSDNRALQAAVDYIAALGGGTVNVGPGVYTMRDSLHLRSGVTVRGAKGQTVLKKAAGRVSPMGLDGDFGEQQITLVDSKGFQVGDGVAIRDERSGGFHTTVARITGRTGNSFSIDKPLMADCLVSRGATAGTLFPVVSGYHIENARVEDLVIEGGKDANSHLNGCRGATNDLVFEQNTIRDTRPAGQRTQTVGVLIESTVGPVTLKDNQINAKQPVVDQRSQ